MKEITAKKAERLAAKTDLAQSRHVKATLKAIYATIEYTARIGKSSITWIDSFSIRELILVRSHLVTRGFQVTEAQKTWEKTDINKFKMVISW